MPEIETVVWLDTQTKELLQKIPDEKLAPSKVAEFALVLLSKGSDPSRLRKAISEINRCSEAAAAALARQRVPVTINRDLTEEAALQGQFELICCDAASVFLRSEVVQRNDKSYLHPLFQKMLRSPEFKPAKVKILQAPQTETAKKFIQQFLGANEVPVFPMSLTVPYKKARIMEHWAERVDVEMKIKERSKWWHLGF